MGEKYLFRPWGSQNVIIKGDLTATTVLYTPDAFPQWCQAGVKSGWHVAYKPEKLWRSGDDAQKGRQMLKCFVLEGDNKTIVDNISLVSVENSRTQLGDKQTYIDANETHKQVA